MKKTLALLLCVLLVLSFTACGTNQTSQNDSVVMTYVTSPLNVPSILDKEHGYYKDAFSKLGLNLEYSTIDSGADQTVALASGDIQFLNAVGGASVILAASNGMDIVILSMYSRAPKAFAMFSNDDTINSPEDLRGLTIAGPKGTNLHELLVAYLATAGMTIEDVDYVSMDIPSANAALEGGSIDVALLGGAASYNAITNGKHLICDGEGLISATICTATTRKYADENPEVVKAFLATQKEIIDYMNNETASAISESANALDLDESAVQEMYEMYDFNPEIADDDITLMQRTEQFLFDAGMIENHVDLKDLIY